MSSTGRPPHQASETASRMQGEVLAYLKESGLVAAELGRRAGVASSTVGRTLTAEPARETEALLKLHKAIHRSGDDRLATAVSAIERLAEGPASGDTTIAVRILRAVADLLEGVRGSR